VTDRIPLLIRRDADRRIGRAGRVMQEVFDQRCLHPEHGVAVEVFAFGVEQMCRHRPATISSDDHVQMCGAPRVAPGCSQHPPDRAVSRHRIVERSNADEAEPAVGLGREHPTQVALRCVRILRGVEHVRAVLPDVDAGAGDRCTR
jgi:hypothetical protein